MSIWKGLWNIVETIGVVLIKKNNPAYATAIDAVVKAVKEDDFKAIKDVTDKMISEKQAEKIQRELDKALEERLKALTEEELLEPEPVGGSTIAPQKDSMLDDDILQRADFSTLKTKYMTAFKVRKAPEDMNITSNNYKDIRCDSNESFKKGDYGFFPVVITTDNKVYHGAHGSKGGMKEGVKTRNTGLAYKHAKDYGVPIDKIKYYFLVRTSFEGKGKKVYGRSQLKEI